MRVPSSLSVLALAAVLAAGCATLTGKPPSSADQAPTAPPAGGSAAPTAFVANGGELTAATPEDAVKAYLAALAKGDANGLLAATSSAEQATKVRFDLYVDRLQAFLPMQNPAPGTDPFYAETNRLQLQGQVVQQARMLAYSLLSDKVTGPDPISPADAAWATAFASDTAPSKLAGLAVGEVAFPMASKKDNATVKDAFAKSAATWGADEQTERVALITLGDKTWYVGFTLLRYGSGWGVSSQVSNLAGTDFTGLATPTTPDDFKALTGS